MSAIGPAWPLGMKICSLFSSIYTRVLVYLCGSGCFFWLLTNWFLCGVLIQRTFGVSTLEKTAHDDVRKLASAIYLQVSIISQALIFVTRSRSWSFVERPGMLLVVAFVIAQLVSQLPTIFILHSLLVVKERFPNLSLVADCYFDCSLRKLELCCNWRDWLGLGWCDLAL